MVLLGLEVVAGRQVEPEPVGGAEAAREPQGRVGCDPARPVHDLVGPTRRHTDRDRQVMLSDVQGTEELLQEYLAGPAP